MGTRALISKNENPFIATHWDGNPSSLGNELLGTKTDEEIIKVAEKHSIDFADRSIQAKLNKKRFEKIAKRANKCSKDKKYTAKDLEDMYKKGRQITFTLQHNDDSPIGDIKNYGDFAEYQYDLQKGGWYYRELSGCWDESGDKGAFKKLTKKECKGC